jgi:hypothetical protein
MASENKEAAAKRSVRFFIWILPDHAENRAHVSATVVRFQRGILRRKTL